MSTSKSGRKRLSSNCSKLRTRPRLACTSLQKPRIRAAPRITLKHSNKTIKRIEHQSPHRSHRKHIRISGAGVSNSRASSVTCCRICDSHSNTKLERRTKMQKMETGEGSGVLEARNLHEPTNVV